jgi:hypothetical protein
MRTLEELKKQRDETAELEREVFDDIKAKAALLGYTLTKESEPQAPKQKRKRRTKQEIETDKARMPRNEL